MADTEQRTEGPISAKEAGLCYVSDQQPGIQRRRAGTHFRYFTPQHKPITNPKILDRIAHLAIPPAWTKVWICPKPNGHLQATGRDQKGRKQYRYHAKWREVRDEAKFTHMIAFGKALPTIRKHVAEDLRGRDLTRVKILATIVRLLETTLIRVGNPEYARDNNSYGLTTMRDKHVDINGSKIHFHFKGKSGVRHSIDLRDHQLATIVKRCKDIPGFRLFQYVDEQGQHQAVEAGDVNDYLRSITNQDFTAKDFRTWAGTLHAICKLRDFGECDSETQAKQNVVRAVEQVAEDLGNTPAVCRKCYIHPAVIDAYLEGTLFSFLKQHPDKAPLQGSTDLTPAELTLLNFLQHHQSPQESSNYAKSS